MIKNYADHASNERTFLSWVRTATSLIGFGIVIERLPYILQSSQAGTSDGWAQWTGVVLVLLGSGLYAVALRHFYLVRRLIDDDKVFEDIPTGLEFSVAVLLVVLSLTMLMFVIHAAVN